MISDFDTAAKIAEFLLQIKAIKLQPQKPFTWASGWKSPIYCDNRLTLSYPRVRTYIRQEFARIIEKEFGSPDLIAGVATGAIAHGALVAEALDLPFAYVRSAAKEHGMGNLIEGHVEKGNSVVIIEDLISTGGSSLKAVEALREAGCEVKGMVGIFTYGFEAAEASFEKAHCKLITLSDYENLLKTAIAEQYISEKDLATLTNWRIDPANWGN
jgi:orotate phosphoribosyltransferase